MNTDSLLSCKPFEWNKIYEIDENNYAAQLEGNREYYLNIDPSQYSTIYDCVTHAIREGNHAAFAHFFLNEEISRNKVFGRVLSKILDEREIVDNYDKVKCWINAPIIQQKYWRALDFEFSSENIKREITDKKKKTIVYGMNLDTGKESQQRKNWRTGKAIPPRDVIVQIAICLGISIDGTNQLLRAACEPALYVLDAVDVCSMFTIREYENNYTVDPFNKLKMTKDRINEILRECLNNNMSTVPFSNLHFLGSSKPLGIGIDEEIKELQRALGEDETNEKDTNVSLTTYLTRLFEDRFKNSNDLASFVGYRPIDRGEARSPYLVFLQKYYGFLHRTKMFIDNTERYEKNMRYSGWSLTADGKNSLTSLQRQSNVENQRINNTTVTSKNLRKVDKVWHIADLVGKNGKEFNNGDDWINFKSMQGSLTIPRQIIEGRKINSGSKHGVYEMDFGNKVHLMKFAIATGNEDEAGKYLQLAGVWERDWYEVFKKQKEVEANLDRSDFLLLYALLVRDRLIERWNTDNDSVYASQIRSDFPMIKLLLIINRDISFASMKLYDDKGKMRDYDHTDVVDYYEADLVRIQTEMIYPIAWYFLKQKVRNKSLNLKLDEENDDKYRIGLWRWRVKNSTTKGKDHE